MRLPGTVLPAFVLLAALALVGCDISSPDDPDGENEPRLSTVQFELRDSYTTFGVTTFDNIHVEYTDASGQNRNLWERYPDSNINYCTVYPDTSYTTVTFEFSSIDNLLGSGPAPRDASNSSVYADVFPSSPSNVTLRDSATGAVAVRIPLEPVQHAEPASTPYYFYLNGVINYYVYDPDQGQSVPFFTTLTAEEQVEYVEGEIREAVDRAHSRPVRSYYCTAELAMLADALD